MTVNEPHFMTAWCSLLIQSERKYFFWRCRRSRHNRICLSKLDSVIIVSIMNVSNDRLCIIQFRFVLTSIQFYFCALWTFHRNAFFHLHKHIWFNLEFSFRFFFLSLFSCFVLIFFSFFLLFLFLFLFSFFFFFFFDFWFLSVFLAILKNSHLLFICSYPKYYCINHQSHNKLDLF